MSPWDDAETVRAWLAFERRFDRYRVVNEALAERAGLEGASGLRVLDVGAGTGGTARALLARLDADSRVCCVEPAAAMRDASGLHDARVTWVEELPDGRFDRVVCGASLWLLGPIEGALGALRARLKEGGALVFAIPSSYLGEPDPSGEGEDPRLVELPRRFTAGRREAPPPGEPLPDAGGLEGMLTGLGLRPERFAVETTWTTASYAAWLALPPVAASMRPDLPQGEREALLRRIEAELDPGSRRPERWSGWAAWA